MQTEAQGEGSAFLMGKALGFYSNHIRRFKQEVDDRDYFNIIGEVMGREQILDAIGQALDTRGIPWPAGFGEKKNDEETHEKVLPKIKNIDKKSLFRGTGTRPPACACPHADRLEPV